MFLFFRVQHLATSHWQFSQLNHDCLLLSLVQKSLSLCNQESVQFCGGADDAKRKEEETTYRVVFDTWSLAENSNQVGRKKCLNQPCTIVSHHCWLLKFLNVIDQTTISQLVSVKLYSLDLPRCCRLHVIGQLWIRFIPQLSFWQWSDDDQQVCVFSWMNVGSPRYHLSFC